MTLHAPNFLLPLHSLLSFLCYLLFLLCTSFKRCQMSARAISLSSSQFTFSPFSGFIAPCMLVISKLYLWASPLFSSLDMNVHSHLLDVIIQLSHRQRNFTVSRPEPIISPPPNVALLLLPTSIKGINFNLVAQEICKSSLISPLPQPTHPTI